jgi:hypothetical protein
VTLDYIDPMCFLSVVYIGLNALMGLLKPYTFRIWVHTSLLMLSLQP